MNKPTNLNECTLSYIDGNPASARTLEKLKSQKIDSIVLAGLEDRYPKIADAQLISTLIQLQEMATSRWEDKSGFTVVSPLNFTETKQVADHLISEGRNLPTPIDLEVLIPVELAGGILVQVARSPVLDMVFGELLTSDGAEIYLRYPAEFDFTNKDHAKIYEIEDAIRMHGETFIG